MKHLLKFIHLLFLLNILFLLYFPIYPPYTLPLPPPHHKHRTVCVCALFLVCGSMHPSTPPALSRQPALPCEPAPLSMLAQLFTGSPTRARPLVFLCLAVPGARGPQAGACCLGSGTPSNSHLHQLGRPPGRRIPGQSCSAAASLGSSRALCFRAPAVGRLYRHLSFLQAPLGPTRVPASRAASSARGLQSQTDPVAGRPSGRAWDSGPTPRTGRWDGL